MNVNNALGSAVTPEETRGSGLALLGTTTSLARFAASLAFGALWTIWGMDAAVVCFAAALIGAAALAALVLSRNPEPASA